MIDSSNCVVEMIEEQTIPMIFNADLGCLSENLGMRICFT